MKFTTIKYLVSKKERIGNIPYNSLITNVKLICLGDSGDALIYFPKKAEYEYLNKKYTEKGTGSLSFAQKNRDGTWSRSGKDYLNTDSRQYE